MKFFFLLSSLMVLFFLFSNASLTPDEPARTEFISHHLSAKKMLIKKSHYGTQGLDFLILHDNENTGLIAAEIFCKLNGGSITELLNDNERFISLKIKKSSFSFDPNGIFEDEGIIKSLKKYSSSKITPLVISQTRDFAKKILDVYREDNKNYIITLHNNTDGNFDISYYRESGSLAHVVDSINVNPEMDPDDLVLVTDTRFYSFFKSRNVNVVYQSPSTAIDGSLSVYAQRNNIPYINIEIQHGHESEHLRLISLIDEMFREHPDYKLAMSANVLP